MKSIINYLTETRNDYLELSKEYPYTKSAKYLWLNTEGDIYGFMTDKHIEAFGKDFDDEESVKEILGLKVGEVFDADGGINIYFRIA